MFRYTKLTAATLPFATACWSLCTICTIKESDPHDLFYYRAIHSQNSEIEEFETMVLCRSSGEQDSLTLDGFVRGLALCEPESLLLSLYQ